MKFGLCISSDKALTAYDAGADYYEISASGELYEITDSEYQTLKSRVLSNEKIKPYSTNGLVSGTVKLCGPEADTEKISGYAEKVFGRLSGLGIKMLVFGSGKAREIPDGYPSDKAYGELLRSADIFSDVAAKYGQTLALEPLRKKECNIINTVAEGADFVRKVAKNNFRLLADFYHVSESGEDFKAIEQNSDIIAHLHISSRERSIIKDSDRGYISEIAALLKKINYSGAISYEGGQSTEAQEIKHMFEILREYFGR